MIRVLVSDLGNVVALFDHHRACRQLAALSSEPLTADEVFSMVFAGLLELGFDLGRLSSDEFVQALRTQLKIAASDQAIARAWCDIFEPNPEVIEILRRLKAAGTRLVLASNTNALHYEWIAQHHSDLLAPLDDAVLSYELGCRKPERRFFEECVKRAGVPVHACVFVDDRQDFVDAARSLGMRGVTYRTGMLASDLEREGLPI